MKKIVTIIGDNVEEISEDISFFIDNLPPELKEKDITKLEGLMEYIKRHLSEITIARLI